MLRISFLRKENFLNGTGMSTFDFSISSLLSFSANTNKQQTSKAEHTKSKVKQGALLYFSLLFKMHTNGEKNRKE